MRLLLVLLFISTSVKSEEDYWIYDENEREDISLVDDQEYELTRLESEEQNKEEHECFKRLCEGY